LAGDEIGLTAFSRSIRYRRYQCTSDHNSLPRACRYERGGQHLYSVTTIETSLLTLRFYRNFGLPTCENCTPVPRHSLCFDNLSPRCLSIRPHMLCRSCFALNISWLQYSSEKGSLLPHSGCYLVPHPSSPPSRRNLSREMCRHHPAFDGV
jgi:hypothetical protein